jgi:prepilin-type N-terminal cleavage/methylation domain-containing protein
MKSVKKGFTLIEVICSMFILGLALVALQQMVSTGFKTSTIIEDRLIAYNLLERKMESLHGIPFASLADESRGYLSDFTDYEMEVDVTNPIDGDSNLTEIQITIYWTSALNQEISETVSTYRANY